MNTQCVIFDFTQWNGPSEAQIPQSLMAQVWAGIAYIVHGRDPDALQDLVDHLVNQLIVASLDWGRSDAADAEWVGQAVLVTALQGYLGQCLPPHLVTTD